MATLTREEEVRIRRAMAQLAVEKGFSINYIKDAVRDAAQAVEDRIEGARGIISNDIDTATQPYGLTLTVAQKKYLFAVVMKAKYIRDILD